ncbi:MAG: histidine phosphatase family protein, partial [Reyranella sp.]|nr:histidine phosphatase family protein [Reyranella sp.]
DEQSLIVRGWQRAGALVGLFGKGAPLPAPDRIYASATIKLKTPDGKIGSKSKRPTQTVSVLSAKLGLKTNGAFTRGQEAELVAEIATLAGTTLVCWQHEMIPTIAANIMGNAVGLPTTWPGDRFDVVWRFTRASAGAPWSFDQVCERLLPGDGGKPIT